MKRIVWVTALLLLAGCNLNPQQRHVTAAGQACVQVGPPWAQSWLTPDRMRAC